ncbi:MAG: hypothetical protein MHMPM18_001582 [Marteilia pararefringens]
MADAAAAQQVDQSSSWCKEGEGGDAADDDEEEEMKDDHHHDDDDDEDDFEIVTFDLDQSPPGGSTKLTAENGGIDDDSCDLLRASTTTNAAVARDKKMKKQSGKTTIAAIAKEKITEAFKTGDLVWIKHSRYPIWPAFIHNSCGSMKSRKLKVIFSFIEYYDNLLFLNPKFKSTLIYDRSIFPFSTSRREEFINKILETKYSANICYIVSECDHYIIERAVGKERTLFDVKSCEKFTNSFGEMKYDNNLGDEEPKYDESSTQIDLVENHRESNNCLFNIEQSEEDLAYDVSDSLFQSPTKNSIVSTPSKKMTPRKKIYRPTNLENKIVDIILTNQVVKNTLKNINLADLIPYIIITAINHLFTLESDGLKLATRYFFTYSNSTRAHKLMEIDKYMSALEKIPKADRQSLKSKIISKISSIK